MSYSEITFDDKNPIKSWLQRGRLIHAIKLAPIIPNAHVVVDFGAGNGELCKLLSGEYPRSTIICYEPAPELMAEARTNLEGYPRIEFVTDINGIPKECVDLLFCLEVFEHLPATATDNTLDQINGLLRKEGAVVFGVPVEVGIPALYKGIFRMVRRFGAYDATVKNVLLATLGIPPQNRPCSEIAPGFSFCFEHLGFDYRSFRKVISQRFHLHRTRAYPFPTFGTWFNTEVYFIVKP